MLGRVSVLRKCLVYLDCPVLRFHSINMQLFTLTPPVVVYRCIISYPKHTPKFTWNILASHQAKAYWLFGLEYTVCACVE